MKLVRIRVTIIVGLCLWSMVQNAVAADRVTIELKNGDRVSGSVVSETKEAVRLKTDFFGEVSIPASEVKDFIEIPGEKRVEVAEKGAVRNQVASNKESNPAEEDALQSAPSGLRKVAQSLSFQDWKKRLEMGMTSQTGRRDKTDFSMRYTMNRKVGKDQHRVEARYYYGETTTFSNQGVPNIQKSTDKFSAYYRFRRDIAPGVFYESNSLYSWDAVKEIDLNAEQKLGLGYRFYNDKDFKLSTGAGASTRLRDDLRRDSEFEYLVDLFQDLDYRMNKRLRFTQDLRFAVPLEESDDYEINFRTGLISDITDSINMSMRYELEYDHSLDPDRREDQRFISSLGYNF